MWQPTTCRPEIQRAAATCLEVLKVTLKAIRPKIAGLFSSPSQAGATRPACARRPARSRCWMPAGRSWCRRRVEAGLGWPRPGHRARAAASSPGATAALVSLGGDASRSWAPRLAYEEARCCSASTWAAWALWPPWAPAPGPAPAQAPAGARAWSAAAWCGPSSGAAACKVLVLDADNLVLARLGRPPGRLQASVDGKFLAEFRRMMD